MNGFVFIILVFILLYFFQGKSGKNKKKSVSSDNIQRKLDSWTQSVKSEQLRQARRTQPKFGQKKKSRSESGSGRLPPTMVYKAARRRFDQLEGQDSIRDPSDRNRQRRSDWGVRQREGMLSLRNSIYLIAGFLLVLWFLSALPADLWS